MRIARVAHWDSSGAVAIVLALCGFAYNFATSCVDFSHVLGPTILIRISTRVLRDVRDLYCLLRALCCTSAFK